MNLKEVLKEVSGNVGDVNIICPSLLISLLIFINIFINIFIHPYNQARSLPLRKTDSTDPSGSGYEKHGKGRKATVIGA